MRAGPRSRPRSAAAIDFAKRQRARRWLRWRPLVLAAGVLVVVGAAVWGVLFSSLLGVDRVEVEGTDLLSAATVRSAAAVPAGEPLARVDLAAAEARVEELVEVADATVRRGWPDAVVVEVTEREAVAVVVVEDRFRGMDETGVLFRDFARQPPRLPVVRISAGTRTEALAEAAAVLRHLPPVLDGAVDHVIVRTVDDITVVLRDGRRVVWGSAEDSGNKGDVLAILLEQETGDAPVREYDVSVPGQPTTRS
ncbi:cell division protein FtsQ/DivIB [Nocardioides massiliensis]|uniref:Cell division protein FtsQ n=1 Tax=Nocardioides massiliensis TaxID=1325935 RepID=A0ABT9NSV7_9ACTN|nr:FtsQ-type POTRA domain-containing protein [Nocardioides massiliensis]MDP9823506.1 cell division protein FtsQ [Nocardioides massiliensis]